MTLRDHGALGLTVFDGRRRIAVAQPVTDGRRPWILRLYGACWYPRLPAGRGVETPDVLVVSSRREARKIMRAVARCPMPATDRPQATRKR